VTTSIREHIDFLKVIQLGLEYRLLDRKIIIDWADKIIQQDDIPEGFIIDLSLSEHKSVDFVVTLINEYVPADFSNSDKSTDRFVTSKIDQ
jgi:hypothetical protein